MTLFTDTARAFDTGVDEDVTIDCPAGCLADPNNDPVYGGDPNYSEVWLKNICNNKLILPK